MFSKSLLDDIRYMEIRHKMYKAQQESVFPSYIFSDLKD